MRLVTMFKFALQSVTSGLALAFVVLILKPEWIPGMAGTTAVTRGSHDDVVSYSRAVAIAINEARQPRVGDVVLAIGNPFGVGKPVTMGIVSATGRSRIGLNTFEDFIQTDAAINPGNSGGALINPYGELVGINTAIYSDSGLSRGIGFAIPAAPAHRVRQEIVDHGYVVRGWLGIEVQAFADTEAGRPTAVTVVNVLPNTPAEKADLQAGDVLTRVGDTPVDVPQSALNTIARVKPGNRVSLGIVRSGEPREVVITVAQRPPEG